MTERSTTAGSPAPTIALDTTIVEASMTAGELEMLLFVLERSRAQFAWKVGDLDAGALRRPHPPTVMTLGGLVKHLARVEDEKVAVHLRGERPGAPWQGHDEEWEWRSAAEDSPAELYTLWRDAVARARTAWTAAIADGGLDQPSAIVLPDGARPNLRRFLYDLHDEYARHVGHADLLREAVDGRVGEDPPQ